MRDRGAEAQTGVERAGGDKGLTSSGEGNATERILGPPTDGIGGDGESLLPYGGTRK